MTGWSNRLMVFVLAQGAVISRAATTHAGPVPSMPMRIDEGETAVHRWLNKPVLESRLLDDMENPGPWSHHGPGAMSLTHQRSKDGQQSVRLESPTKTGKPGEVAGRPFGEAVARGTFPGGGWRRVHGLW